MATAQENATFTLKSGERSSGQLIDLGGVGFTVRVNGQERQIRTNDVSVIDFTGGGTLADRLGSPERRAGCCPQGRPDVTGNSTTSAARRR